jgi:hypothetical protein
LSRLWMCARTTYCKIVARNCKAGPWSVDVLS